MTCISHPNMTVTSENMCAERRFRSACAFAQSDQNLPWAHFVKLRMQRFFTQLRKTLIRLHETQAVLSLHWADMSEGALYHFLVRIINVFKMSNTVKYYYSTPDLTGI